MAVMNQVLVLFFLIFTGYLVRKLKLVHESMDTELSNLIMKVTLPFFLITSMQFDFSKEVLLDSVNLIYISAGVYAGIILLSYLVVKIIRPQEEAKNVYQWALCFSNVGFMGYPVLDVVYGQTGVFYAALYNLSFNVLIWTFGVHLYVRHQKRERETALSRLKSILNPGLLAILIVFGLFLLQIELPVPVYETMRLIGRTTTPLSMMFIGFMLSELKISELFNNYRDYVASAFRLVISPFLVYLVLRSIGLTDYLIGIPVIITAMPVAASSALFARRFNGDAALASKLVFMTTLLSVATIPIFIALLS